MASDSSDKSQKQGGEQPAKPKPEQREPEQREPEQPKPEQPERKQPDRKQPEPDQSESKHRTAIGPAAKDKAAQQLQATESQSPPPAAKHQDRNEIDTPGPLGAFEKFCKLWKKNRGKAGLALLAVGVVGVLAWLSEPWWDEWRERLCDMRPSLCPQPPVIRSAKLTVSTEVSQCLSGYVSFKLRNTAQDAEWGPGTQKLLICGNGVVEAAPSELLSAFAKTFPRCLSQVETDEKITIALNFESGAICRAAYAVQGGRIVPSTLESGVNLCIREAELNIIPDARQFIISESNDVRKIIFSCNKDDIEAYGF